MYIPVIKSLAKLLPLDPKKNWRLLVPAIPTALATPNNVKYVPHFCRILFPTVRTLRKTGSRLSIRYDVWHWGHFSALGALEVLPCELCIHFSKQSSCAMRVHLHGCVQVRGLAAGLANSPEFHRELWEIKKVSLIVLTTHGGLHFLLLCIYSKVSPKMTCCKN